MGCGLGIRGWRERRVRVSVGVGSNGREGVMGLLPTYAKTYSLICVVWNNPKHTGFLVRRFSTTQI
jgi:hypothetical protein